MEQLQLTEPASQPREWEIAMTYFGDDSDGQPLIRGAAIGRVQAYSEGGSRRKVTASRGSDRWKEGNGEGGERLAADGSV